MPLVRPCRNRYCPEYGDETGFCPAHRRPPFWSSAPLPPGWAATRAAQLARFPWCAECGAPATEVHHVVSRASGGGDDPSNLRSLCGPCHHSITGREWGGSWP